jgi:(S)-sulfolactate dehydrogenase
MSEIVISEFMDEAVIANAFAGRDVLYDPALVDRPEQLRAALADCRALIVRNRTQVRGALLESAAQLQVVGRLGVGLDNIDVNACAARGIAVRPAVGANDLAVAEYVITAALMLLRRAWFATERVASGQWPRMDLIGAELAGKRLGLVGFGAIARLTAAKGAALGMSIAAFDPFVPANEPAWKGVERHAALEPLLASSHVISLHTPLTSQTRRLIDANALSLVKPGAILINAARGGILDEAALLAALQSGRLGGAALDVFETEPLSIATGEHFRVPNLILTPHIAGVTVESNARVSAVTAEAVLQALSA